MSGKNSACGAYKSGAYKKIVYLSYDAAGGGGGVVRKYRLSMEASAMACV